MSEGETRIQRAGNIWHNRLSRRDFLKFAGATALGSAITACIPAAARTTAGKNGKVQLVYQDWRTDWFPEMAQRMLEQFHALHPNIQVFYTPDPDNLEEKMLLDMAAGTAPDVVSGCCDFFPVWGQKEYLLDLQPYIDADLDQATVAEWDPAQYDALRTAGGMRFGIPKYHGALGLYYNKDLFDEFKVPYPDAGWTHNEYLIAMRLLTHDRDQDGKIDLWGGMVDISWERIQVHVNGWGGHFVDPLDSTKSMMGNDEALSAMEWIRARMWDEKVMASFLNVENMETRQAFINQRIAMVEDGSWALKDILAGANFRVGVAPFPKGPSHRVTLATTDGWGIYSGTRYPEAAWELVKFLISKDYGLAMAQANYLQPARASLIGPWMDVIRKEMPEKSSGLDLNAFAEGHLLGYSVTAEIFKNMEPATRLTRSAWEKIYTLGQEKVGIMKDVSRQIEEAQKSSA
jgi:multiple sugar transport system substrate-binding protein